MLQLRLPHLFTTILVLGILGIVSSCSTPKDVVYFQDLNASSVVQVPQKTMTIKPNDKLSIIVNSRDPQLTDMFNLPYVSRQLGMGTTSYRNSQGILSYSVSPEGDIDFPHIGEIHVAGMTRQEVAGMIKGMLIAKDLVKDPTVTVELLNGEVSVLGEVKNPGRYAIENDNMTILDAIGMAGDLTIYGERNNVKVLRTNGNSQETYTINLLSAEEMRNSPAYFLQQDDVVYIEPNPTRIRQSTTNGNTFQSTSFWISIASMAITLAAVIAK